MRLWRVDRLHEIPICDDRGRRCTLVGPPSTWPKHTWLGRPKEPIKDPATLAELAWLGESAGRFGFLAGIWISVLGVMVRGLFSVSPGWPPWVATFVAPVITALMFRPARPLVDRHYRLHRREELRSAYIRSQRCASCGYELVGLIADEDHCVLCPECGAAWRLVPIPIG
jgi:hypothetical protein